MGTVSFKYDPFDRRIEKIAPKGTATIYLYDGDNLIEGSCGVSNADIYQIQRGSRSVDENYQGAEYSFMHAMSNGNAHQSALAAETGTDAFIRVETREASADIVSGSTSQAMFVFGIAMHPVMDMTQSRA